MAEVNAWLADFQGEGFETSCWEAILSEFCVLERGGDGVHIGSHRGDAE